MPEGHPVRYRDLLRCLKEFGVTEAVRKGKGSKRMLFKADVEGQKQSHPIHPHNNNDEVHTHIVKTVLRRFKIPEKAFWECV